MFPQDVIDAAARVLELASRAGVKLASVEGCTGGLIGAVLTGQPGSSAVFDRAFVTVSNGSRTQMVGVPATLMEVYGAVSDIVAVAMAEGGVEAAGVEVAVASTGIVGPGGGTEDYPGDMSELRMPRKGRPVGLVHLAVARRGRRTLHREINFGDIGRDAARLGGVRGALEMVIEVLGEGG